MSNRTLRDRGAKPDLATQQSSYDGPKKSLENAVKQHEFKKKQTKRLEDYTANFKVGDEVTPMYGKAELLEVEGVNAKVQIKRGGRLVRVAVSSLSKQGVKYEGLPNK